MVCTAPALPKLGRDLSLASFFRASLFTAKGIMQLIQYCEPQSVLLVHGEAVKMEFLKQKIQTVSCLLE